MTGSRPRNFADVLARLPDAKQSGDGDCPICLKLHSELGASVAELVFLEIRHVGDADLLAELAYAQRELAELKATPSEQAWGAPIEDWASLQRHVQHMITQELARRRWLVAYGGPKVQGQSAITTEFIRNLKESVPLVSLIEHLSGTVAFKIGAGRFKYRCPAHGDGDDRDASGFIYENEKRWWCFGCNSGGDAFAAVQAWRQAAGFLDAVRWLANWAGVALPTTIKATGGRSVKGVTIA